jgi:hypothetical protein
MESTEESQQSRGETLRFISRYSQYLYPEEEEAIQLIIRQSYERPKATAQFIEKEWLKEGF